MRQVNHDPSVWQSKDGRAVKVAEMADPHLVNATLMAEQFGNWPEQLDLMMDEVFRRGLEGELAMRRAARQAVQALRRRDWEMTSRWTKEDSTDGEDPW